MKKQKAPENLYESIDQDNPNHQQAHPRTGFKVITAVRLTVPARSAGSGV